MKKAIAGRHFRSDDDVISAVDHFLDNQVPTFFKEGIQKLKTRWQKCVKLRGDYVEKSIVKHPKCFNFYERLLLSQIPLVAAILDFRKLCWFI